MPHRRRFIAGTVAAVLALGVTAVLWIAVRGDGEAPSVLAYAPPEVPTVWPEAGLGGQVAARIVQDRADGHVAGVGWRRFPGKVVHAFVASVLGWSDPKVRETEPGATGTFRWYTVTQTASCPEGSSCPDVPPGNRPTLRIRIAQPVTQGVGGIWSVAAVRSSALRLEARARVPSTGAIDGTAARGIGLHTLAGARWFDGCRTDHEVVDDVGRPSRFEVILPESAGLPPPGCGTVAAGYVYAYAVPRITEPVGDPLLESAPLTDLTIVPIRVSVAGRTPTPTESP
jgi:hypothetical protein